MNPPPTSRPSITVCSRATAFLRPSSPTPTNPSRPVCTGSACGDQRRYSGSTCPDNETLNQACGEVIAASGLSPARIRVTITGGRAPLGSEKGTSGQTLLIAAGSLPGHGAQADVHTVTYSRNERGATVGVKTISYGDNVIALAQAKAKGGTEAIFGNTQGNLCEGTGSNIFIVRDGRIITPPLESGCLAGCTRAILLSICKREGIDVSEENTPLDELAEAEEAFLDIDAARGASNRNRRWQSSSHGQR